MMRSWGCSRAVYTMKFAGEPECGCTLTPHSAGSSPNSASARVCTAHPWPAQPGREFVHPQIRAGSAVSAASFSYSAQTAAIRPAGIAACTCIHCSRLDWQQQPDA